MASLLSWLGDRVKNVEDVVGGVANGVGQAVGGAVNTVEHAFQGNHPQAPQQGNNQASQPSAAPRPFSTGVAALNVPHAAVPVALPVNRPQSTPPPAPQPALTPAYQWVGNAAKAATDFVGSTVNDVAKGVNTAGGVIQTAGNKIDQGVAQAVGNQKLADKFANQKTLLDKGSSILGQGGAVSQQQLQNDTPIQALTQGASTGVHYAPYFLGGGGPLVDKLGAKVVDKVGNNVAGKVAGKVAQAGASGAIAAPTFAAINAIQQGLDSGFHSFDPGQAVQTGLQSGAMVAGTHLAGSAVKAGTDAVTSHVNDITSKPGYNSQAGFAKIPKTDGVTNDVPPSQPIPQKSKLQQTQEAPGQLTRVPLKQAGIEQKTPPAESSSYAYNGTPKLTPPQINTKDYLKQQLVQQEAARKQGTPGMLTNLKNDLNTKMIDSLSPIENTLKKAINNGADIHIGDANHITPQLDRAIRADTIAGQYIKDNGLADVIQHVPNTNTLDQYLIAKHAADLEKNGIKTGRNLEADKQLVNSLAPQYEPHAQAIMKYNQGLLDKTAEYGLISKETAAQLKKQYPNYVPANRIFGEGENPTFKGNGSGKASISTQSVVQKIKGSTRQIESPLASIAAKTSDVIKQGERNKAASILASYKDLPGNPFGITPIRTAENVKARIDLYGQAKELRPAQQQLAKMGRTHAGWARKLQTELDQLNKKGMFLALKPEAPKDVPVRGQAFMYNVAQEIHGARSIADRGPRNIGAARELTGTLSNRQTISSGASANETRQLVNSLINAPKSELERLKSKIVTRENKLGPIIDQIEGIRNAVEGVKSTREALRLEALGYKDLSATNKPTISVFKDGIKEVYETTPEIAAAAKSLNKEQMGILAKIVSIPTRFLRLGATGINVGFAMANLAKDLASAAINSEHPLRSSILNPKVVGKATAASLYHKGQSYSELVREGAGGTSFDIARDAPRQTVGQIRADRNAGTKALYNVTHPSQLLRAVEDTIGRSEEFTRALQYYGNKDAARSRGMNPQDAARYGAHAARNNTVNFARMGEWGAVLNSALPYLNAGIQGSRTFVRNVKERPVQTVAKVAVLSTLPVVTTTLWNTSDPKRKAAYDDISDYEKQGNIIIVPPNPVKDPSTGKWNVIKIPVSQEVANLNNIARNGVEAAVNDSKFDPTAALGDLIGTTTSINAQSPRQIENQVIPQIIKPLIEGMTNQNLFTGNKIVPDSQVNLPASDQVGQYTSGTAKTVGGVIGVSPRMLDNGFKTAFGGAGQNAINLSDQLLASTGVTDPSQVQGKSFSDSITGRFYGAAGKPTSDLVNQEFDKKKQELIATPEYRALSLADKAKALNRLQSDISAVQYNASDTANPGSGYTPPKLTKNQQALSGGTKSASSYATPPSTSRTADYSKSNDAELKALQATYDQKVKDNSYTPAQKIQAETALSKAKVGASFDYATRQNYNLSKAQLNQLITTDPNGKAILDSVVAYGDALKNAGLSTYNKFRNSKTGAVSTTTAPKSSGGRKSSGKGKLKTISISSAQSTANRIKAPKVAKAPSFSKSVGGVKPPTFRVPKISGKPSMGIKPPTGLKVKQKNSFSNNSTV